MFLASDKDVDRLRTPEVRKLKDEYKRICGKHPPAYNCVQWISVDTYVKILEDAIAEGPEGEAVPLRDFPDDIF